ncbi:MAG: protocatechuate 3,4-dioxygenase beta subunit [Phenylobacterium sp.]|jgi:protocatechuate 3,4-dioxygenase beta subunit
MFNRLPTNLFRQLCVIFFGLFVLAACGGSGSDGTTVTPTIGASLVMTVTNDAGETTNTFSSDDVATINVVAKNDFGRGVSGITVTFTTTGGALSQTTTLTDSSGRASVTLSATNSDVGVITITTAATVDSKALSGSKAIEITTVADQTNLLSLTILDANCASPATQVTAGTTLCLQAKLLQNNLPSQNALINFSASLGTLVQSSGLTNASGLVNILLNSDSSIIGAGSAVVTFEQLQASQNYQYFAGDPTDGATELTLSILDASCNDAVTSVSAGSTLCLHVSLFKDSQPQVGEIISLASTLGTLRQATALTNSVGVITVLLDSTTDLLGAGVTTATFGQFSSSQNFAYTSGSATLSLVMLDASCSNELNRVAAGTTLCLQASLVQNNLPVTDELINFSTTLGTVRAPSTLTNSAGVATVLLNSTTDLLGGATATATFGQFTSTQNFEYTDGVPTDSTTISLTILDANCSTVITSTTAGSTLCLQASLIKDNQPLADTIVDFSATAGTLRQTSALTNDAGVVSIFLDSTSDLLGAAVATATFGPFSASKNYEYSDGTPQGNSTLTLSILDASCSTQVTSVTAGTTLCLQASLIKDNQPQINTIVDFSATLGTLRETSALTNSAGVANVFLDSSTGLVNAGVATATSGQLSSPANYEYANAIEGPTAISLSVLDNSCTTEVSHITAGLSFCLKAVLTDDGVAVSGQIVTFLAPLGTLSQDTALTDDDGIAIVHLNSLTTNIGASTVSATYNATLGASQNYQFDQPSLSTPTLSLVILDASCSTESNRVGAGSTLCLQASLVQDNAPVENALINFAATLGTVRAPAALTNAVGVASILLDSTTNLLGGATATATFDTFNTNQNYEYTDGEPQGTTTLKMAILDANCSNEVTGTNAGGTLCLQVELKKDNQPLANTIIDFTATSGTLRQTTALTNSAGLVTVFLDSTTDLLGAAVATASFGTFSDSKNYEYTNGTQQSVTTLSLSVLDASCTAALTSVSAGTSLCLQASLIRDNQPLVNTIVDFTATLGSLRQNSALTNTSGVVSVFLDSTTDLLAAGTVTVSFGQFSASQNYEYTNANSSITLSILDSTCTAEVATVIAGSTLCLKAVLQNNGGAASGEIITFSAPLGTLRQDTVLTDSSGVAFTFVDSTIATTGASTVTATYNATLGASRNYQFTSATPTLSMAILDATCKIPQSQVTAGTILCLQVTVIQNNAPVADALVNFAATLGTLQSTTGLTNTTGVASVLLVSTTDLLGAGTATVSYNQASTTGHYEYTSEFPSSSTAVTLQLLDETCTNAQTDFEAGVTACLTANLTQDGNALANQIIDFTVTSGTLRQNSGLTDSNGNVSVLLDSTTDLLGAAVATANFGAFSAAKNYQYSNGNTQSITTLSLAILDNSCTTVTSSSPAGQPLCLQAVLIKDSQPQVGEIITFATTLGTLRQTSALTNASGIVSIFLDSTTDVLNAGVVTATFGLFNNSQSFELTSATAEGPTDITVTTLNSSCTATTTSFEAGSTVCVQAVLRDNNALVVNEIVTFSAPLGTLRQTTALTDTRGVATVFLDSANTQLGASTVTATYSALAANLNYEFTSGTTTTTEPVITLSGRVDATVTNRFKVGQNFQIQGLLEDGNGTPIADSIVRFTAERGTLATTSALTDNAGAAQVTLTALATEVGAAVATAQTTINGVTYTTSFNYEVLSSDAVELDSAQIGHFDSTNTFVPGVVGTTLTPDVNGNLTLSAGGTMGLTIAIVDQANVRIIDPTSVSFTSACATNSNVNLDATVSTINGEASSTYEDLSCATVNGNQDTIVASITVNNVSLSASTTINLSPEKVGSIEFVSAVPTSLVLQGTGGQGKSETSTLTFKVNGELGNPLAQQAVSFSLDATVGGLSISPASSLTNSQGLVTVRVTSGTAPTAVRVTASTVVDTATNTTIRTQSDLLTVNTGLPDQNSITLSSTVLNPEAQSLTGVEVAIVAYMADSFNNPVPDGTTVNFSTEGGTIQGSCNTVNGSCSVTWTGTNPRVSNHRITISAYAIGHETFFDTNGNNVFDDADGIAISDNTDSGLDRSAYFDSGFIDHSDAWRDDNEDRIFNGSDVLFDFGGDETYSAADGLFNGPNCTHATLCGGDGARSLYVRKSLVMIMSSNNLQYTVTASNLASTSAANNALGYLNGEHVLATNDTENGVVTEGMVNVDALGTVVHATDRIVIADGFSLPMTLHIADDAFGLGQILPVGTTVSISTSTSGVSGTVSQTISNSVGYVNSTGADEYGGTTITFSLDNLITNTDDAQGILTFNFSFPRTTGNPITTNFSIPIEML